MEEQEPTQYYIQVNDSDWNALNDAATSFMLNTYGANGGDNYSTCRKDTQGNCYFLVNPEVEHLVTGTPTRYYHDDINWQVDENTI